MRLIKIGGKRITKRGGGEGKWADGVTRRGVISLNGWREGEGRMVTYKYKSNDTRTREGESNETR